MCRRDLPSIDHRVIASITAGSLASGSELSSSIPVMHPTARSVATPWTSSVSSSHNATHGIAASGTPVNALRTPLRIHSDGGQSDLDALPNPIKRNLLKLRRGGSLYGVLEAAEAFYNYVMSLREYTYSRELSERSAFLNSEACKNARRFLSDHAACEISKLNTLDIMELVDQMNAFIESNVFYAEPLGKAIGIVLRRSSDELLSIRSMFWDEVEAFMKQCNVFHICQAWMPFVSRAVLQVARHMSEVVNSTAISQFSGVLQRSFRIAESWPEMNSFLIGSLSRSVPQKLQQAVRKLAADFQRTSGSNMSKEKKAAELGRALSWLDLLRTVAHFRILDSQSLQVICDVLGPWLVEIGMEAIHMQVRLANPGRQAYTISANHLSDCLIRNPLGIRHLPNTSVVVYDCHHEGLYIPLSVTTAARNNVEVE